LRVNIADGKSKWVRLIGRAYFVPIGNESGYIGVMLDIDQKKRLEIKLTNTKYFYISLFKDFPAMALQCEQSIQLF
jgi:hypothetical protein